MVAKSQQPKGRVVFFDTIRGLSVVSMILFHFTYDLFFISHIKLTWFTPLVIKIWVPSISYPFIFIAGCMCAFSKNSFKRSGVYSLVALAIFAATTFANIDTPINFGIFFCMASCTFVEALISRFAVPPKGYSAAILFLLLFVICIPISTGHIGIGNLVFSLPKELYQTPYLAWAGFPSPSFSSGDYYPLLPYLFLYLSGAAFNRQLKAEGYPKWMKKFSLPLITEMGRHSLIVYILHQPILLLIALFVSQNVIL